MKLLLTSSGLTNDKIANALFDMVGKKPEDISLVFIPTAANGEDGDKSWMEDDLNNLRKYNFKEIVISDISTDAKEVWVSKFKNADVLFFEGGNTYHLMRWINKSGLADMLDELLKTRVFVGVSAGSMVTNKDLALKISQDIYEEDLDETEEMKGLNYVDFYFLPHLNNEYFTKVRRENIEEAIKGMTETIYAADDSSALKVVNGEVEIISEGEVIIKNI